MRIAVLYWSGTGNTEAMARAVAEGAQGAQVQLVRCADWNDELLDTCDAFAFGCPAMGAEQLEESVFEPLFTRCEPALKGKKVALFGSYGWGGGEWMRAWEERCVRCGAELVADGVIAQDAPDEEALAQCRSLGAALKAAAA